MTRRRQRSRPAKTPAKGVLKQPRPVWFVTLMAFVLPGSGQVFNGAPTRGVIMQFGMVFAAFITYMLTTPDISPVGRMAGGLLVYVFSIVDANGIAKLRVKSWERMHRGGSTDPDETPTGNGAAPERSVTRKKSRAAARPKGGTRRKRPARPADQPEGQPAPEADESPVAEGNGRLVPEAEAGGPREPESQTSTESVSSERSSG